MAHSTQIVGGSYISIELVVFEDPYFVYNFIFLFENWIVVVVFIVEGL